MLKFILSTISLTLFFTGPAQKMKINTYEQNGEIFSYEWTAIKESPGRDTVSPGSRVTGKPARVTYQNPGSITSSGTGEYKVYATATDQHNNVGLISVPLQVNEYKMLEDYEGNSSLILHSSTGAYSKVVNPDRSGINPSDSVGRYAAPGNDPYDKFTFNSGNSIEDAAKFRSGDFKIRMDLHTDAPAGTPLKIIFQDQAAFGPHPSGRNSTYNTITSAANTWARVSFDYTNSPDPTVSVHSVDQLAFTFDAGQRSAYTYYMDNIQGVESLTGLPAPWQNVDVGVVGVAGNTLYRPSDRAFIVEGSGNNIWGTTDEFQYAYQPLNSDGEITCQVSSISMDVDDYVKAGLMFRETLEDDSKHILMYTTPASGNAFQYRSSPAGSCAKTTDSQASGWWLKLKRVGNRFEGYQSADGKAWSLIDSVTVPMADTIFVGLAVTSHDNTRKAQATFQNVERVKRANILLVIVDQLNWNALSAMGNEYVHTPNIDRLIDSGVRFDRAYAANPVCIPSRVSMFTGMRPTQMGFHVPKPGLEGYERTDVRTFVAEKKIADQLQKGGYKTYYGGKTHFGFRSYAFTPEDMGFEVYANDKEYRTECVDKALVQLQNHRQNYDDQPFFMVTSLMNPHDICYAHIKDHRYDTAKILDRTDGAGWQSLLRESVLENLEIPEGEIGAGGYEPIDYYLANAPPLPCNFQPQSNEPSVVSGVDGPGVGSVALSCPPPGYPISSDSTGMAAEFGRYRAQYDSIDWLLHRYAYTVFIEEIDKEVGRLLAGIDAMNISDDTFIIFTSDHGEQDGSHQMAGKGLFYDEACHIPFIITHKSVAGGSVDSLNLVSNGLDLLPTVFDLAGLETGEDYQGKSVIPLLENANETLDRDCVPVEFSTGMGIVSNNFYYGIYYNGNDNNEQLYDLRKQPLQAVNDAVDPNYNAQLQLHRQMFWDTNKELLEAYGCPARFMDYLNQDCQSSQH